MMNFYIGKKLLNRYENGTELAKAYNLNADNLQKTMDKYGQEKVDEFGKSVFETKFDFNNVVYGGVVTPAIHYTMGGLKINEKG